MKKKFVKRVLGITNWLSILILSASVVAAQVNPKAAPGERGTLGTGGADPAAPAETKEESVTTAAPAESAATPPAAAGDESEAATTQAPASEEADSGKDEAAAEAAAEAAPGERAAVGAGGADPAAPPKEAAKQTTQAEAFPVKTCCSALEDLVVFYRWRMEEIQKLTSSGQSRLNPLLAEQARLEKQLQSLDKDIADKTNQNPKQFKREIKNLKAEAKKTQKSLKGLEKQIKKDCRFVAGQLQSLGAEHLEKAKVKFKEIAKKVGTE